MSKLKKLKKKYEDHQDNPRRNKQVTLSDVVELAVGETSGTVKALLRQSHNLHSDWNSIHKATSKLLRSAQQILPEALHNALSEDFEEWCAEIDSVLELTDASLELKTRAQSREDEFNKVLEPLDYIYRWGFDPGYNYKDAWGTGTPKAITDPMWILPRSTRSSRKEWKRVTKDEARPMRILCDYGNFDLATTEAAAHAMLRVRTVVRKINNVPTPFLGVGAIWINMTNGHAECGVQGCKFRVALTHTDPQPKKRLSDRHWQEYQVMRLLQHIGDHDTKGLFPKILEVPLTHTTDAEKLHSRALATL